MMEPSRQSLARESRWSRIRVVLLALLAAAGVFVPWGSSQGGGTWIASASWADAHHLAPGLEAASRLVTAVAAGLAVLGAVLRLVAQRRRGAVRAGACGLIAVCMPLSLLMPVPGAACFLAACCAILLYDMARANASPAEGYPAAGTWVGTLARETFPILSAGAFLVFGWQYNAQLLIRLLLVAAGLALIVRAAALSSRERPPARDFKRTEPERPANRA